MKQLTVKRLMLTALALFWALAQAATAQEPGARTYQSEEVIIHPAPPIPVERSDVPPVLTEEQRRAREKALENVNRPGPPLPEGPAVPPLQGEDAQPLIPVPIPLGPDPGKPRVPGSSGVPAAPLDFVVSRATDLWSAVPYGETSTTNEPTADGYGAVVVYSANWFLAVSSNSGASFSYLSPYSLMSGVDGGFCCDQVVTYDPSRDLLFILLMSIPSVVTQRNTYRLFVVGGGQAGFTYSFAYDITPQSFGFPAGEWQDFPNLTVGGNYLYLTSNNYTPAGCSGSACSWVRTLILRLPLNTLATGGTLTGAFFQQNSVFNFRVAEGIGTTAYWASHVSTSTIRVFSWPEGSSSITSGDRTLSPAWSQAVKTCPGPDGRDWCGFSDGRMVGAFMRPRSDGPGNEIGFLWASAQQASLGYPWPYVRLALFAESGLSPISQYALYGSTFAVMFPAAAPNVRGALGLAFAVGGGSLYPSAALCIWDIYGFACALPALGTHGPGQNRWGDYLAVRKRWPGGYVFRGTGYVLVGGTGGDNVHPYYFEFGREFDYYIFQDDMESGPGSWSPQAPWGQTTATSHSPTHSWTDSPSGNYGNTLNVSLFSPTLNFSGFTSVTLTFWHRYDLESGYDFGRVWVTTDNGATWTLLSSFTGTNTTWQQATVNLNSFAGRSTVLFAFQLWSDFSVTRDGWYIDDVVVSGSQ